MMCVSQIRNNLQELALWRVRRKEQGRIAFFAGRRRFLDHAQLSPFEASLFNVRATTEDHR
jgi:hypothetical protein